MDIRETGAVLIRQWKPWEQSTGPRTPEGKARAAHNSFVHGEYDAHSRELRRALAEYMREQRRVLERL